MAQLPIPGGDAGTWGSILNDFLSVSLNADGTLNTAALTTAGSYLKPSTGIPASDLSSAVQSALSSTTTAVQSVNGLTGSAVSLTPSTIGALPTTTKLAGLADTSGAAEASNGQVLSYNSTTSQWVASTVSSTTVSDATTSSKGIVELNGDLGGTAASPSVLKVNGTSVSGTPSSGQALIASSSTAAAWSALPSAPVTSVNSQTGAVTLTASEVGAVPASEVGTASGVASLNSSGQVPTTQLATGSGSTSNYLRGDGSWTTPPTGSTTLAADTDVSLSSPTNNQVLTYNTGSSKWVNQNAPTASNATSSTPGLIQLDGDLSGSATGPTVAKLDGISLPGTMPVASQVLTATSGTATAWATPAAGVTLDTTSSDIAPLGTQIAGSIGKAADSGHVHAMPRLDQVNSPTASVSLNSQKITNVANGSASSDAAAFGQIPVVGAAGSGASNALSANDPTTTNSRTPTGTAGGDLSGTYPNPTVAKANGIALPSSAPASGQVLTATSASATAWSTPSSSLPPSGTAGGDLSGTYPNPTVAKVNGTSVSGTPSSGQAIIASSGTAASWSTIPTASNATSSTPGLIQLDGDLDGTATTPKVASLQGITVPSSTPSTGQVLTATSTSATAWQTPASAPVSSVDGMTGAVTGLLLASNNLSDMSDAGSSRANIHVPVLTPAAAVSVTNVTSLATSTATVDGYGLASGDLVLLTAQSTSSQNGLWSVPASGSWTRPTEFASGATIKGRTVLVMNGTVYANTQWALDTPTVGIVIDTTAQSWKLLSVLSGTYVPIPESVNTQASVSGSYTLPDITVDTIHRLTLTGNATLNLPTPAAGKSLTAVTSQDATGGRMITWATPSGAIKWPGGASPAYTSTASATDVTTFMCADGTNWLGMPAGYAFA